MRYIPRCLILIFAFHAFQSFHLSQRGMDDTIYGPETVTQTFVVTNTSSSGAGSLAQAITDANANPGLDSINFNISGSGLQFFPLSSALPAITSPVIIDGTTQPGYAGAPLITMIGISNGAALNITAGGSTVKGLALYDFIGTNTSIITISGGGGNTITSCFFGINANNSRGSNTSSTGVVIDGSTGNRIGGATAAERNYFVINSGVNIALRNGASGNRVTGNWFGVGPNGARQTMQRESVRIENAPNNTIGGSIGATPGGSCTGECNAIGATGFQGGRSIYINGTGATGNRVAGNFVGLFADGMTVNRTDGVGVYIDGAPNNIVGGTTAAERNVIAGNTDSGVWIQAAASTGNVVSGNYIGLFTNGSAAPPIASNAIRGVTLFTGSTNTRVGGLTPGERNIISGNRTGILIQSSSNNRVQGNYIGTDATGMLRSTTSDHGVFLFSGANNNTIGGTEGTNVGGSCAGACNVISGNGTNGTSDGIRIAQSNENRIDGNFIGWNAAGTLPLLNGVTPDGSIANGSAMSLLSSNNNTIGRRALSPQMAGGIDDERPMTVHYLQDNVTGNWVRIDDQTGEYRLCHNGVPKEGRGTLTPIFFGSLRAFTTDSFDPIRVFGLISTTPNSGGHVKYGYILPNGTFAPDVAFNEINDPNTGDFSDQCPSVGEYTRQYFAGKLRIGGSAEPSSNNHVELISSGLPPDTGACSVECCGICCRDIGVCTGDALIEIFGDNNAIIDSELLGERIGIQIMTGNANHYEGIILRHGENSVGVDIANTLTGYPPTPAITTEDLPNGNVRITINVAGAALGSTLRFGLTSVDLITAPTQPPVVLGVGIVPINIDFPDLTVDAAGNGSLTVEYNADVAGRLRAAQAVAAYATYVTNQRPTDGQVEHGEVLGGTSELSVPARLPGASVSGRVTTPGGQALRNAIVYLTDVGSGVRRSSTSSSFGLYSFDNVSRMRQYVISVSSKRYRFAPRQEFIVANLGGVDLVGLE